MASIREQRRAERKRGAVQHQVQNVDFALTFPSESIILPRSGRKDNSDPASNRNESIPAATPAPRGRPPGARNSQKRPASASTSSKNSANTSAKRQKLDSQSTPSTRSTRSQRTSRASLYNLPEEKSSPSNEQSGNVSLEIDELDEVGDMLPLHASNAAPHELLQATPGRTRRNTSNRMDELEPHLSMAPPARPYSSGRKNNRKYLESPGEIGESPASAPGSGQKVNRVAQAQASSKKPGVANAPSSSSLFETPSRISAGAGGSIVPRKVSAELASSLLVTTSQVVSPSWDEDDIDELSPEQPKKLQAFSDNEDEIEEAEEIDDLEAAARLHGGRRSRRNEPDASIKDQEVGNDGEVDREGDEGSSEADELHVEAGSKQTRRAKTVPKRKTQVRGDPAAQQGFKGPRNTLGASYTQSQTSPAVQRQPKPPKSKARAANASSKAARESIRIPVHRLTKPLVFAEDSDTDADILNAPIPFAKRGGVNAVDVLAEFCEETVENGLAVLSGQVERVNDNAARRELRLKLRAVEAWQEEVRVRLLDLTHHLDEHHRLSKHVRSSHQEIKHLREEFKRLRSEREQIALRKDAVRIKHEQDSKATLVQTTLQTQVQDIELALEQCRSLPLTANEMILPPPPLNSLITTIASKASCLAPGGGILAKIQGFNGFLERAAMALEGKL